MPTLAEPVANGLPGFVKKREIARFLNVSPRTIDKWIADRRIPYIKVNPRLNLFRLRDVEKALTKRTVHEA
jgi:excisionase family DNA binding protein